MCCLRSIKLLTFYLVFIGLPRNTLSPNHPTTTFATPQVPIMTADIHSALPSTCTVHVPDPDSKPQDTIPGRWSDILVAQPFAVVTPSTIPDIIATIEFAARHSLKVIPAGGGRGSFVPITHDVIYLDLRKFDSFKLNQEKAEVQIGGTCMSGPLLKSLAKEGYYAPVPNSNGVGMTGALLGGLNHPLCGLYGMGSDMVKSFTIVPFSSPNDEPLGPITISRESTQNDKKLFDMLRGAGHGIGVIVSATVEVHPVATLNLEDGDKVWQRTLVFAPNAVGVAIETYLALQKSVPKEMNFFLGYMRAPPTAPRPGAPVILLSISYFGPSSAAEAATTPTFLPEVLSRTVNANTGLTPLGNINDILDPVNKAGGYKELHGAFVHSISAASLGSAFASFIEFTEKSPTRYGSSVIFPVSNTAKSESLAGKGDFYNSRDRGIYVQVKTSYSVVEEKGEADAFAKAVHDVAREEDRKAGRRDWAFANNLVEGLNMKDVYTEDQIAEICRMNHLQNRDNVGWCPTTEGWRWYTKSREQGRKPGTIDPAMLKKE